MTVHIDEDKNPGEAHAQLVVKIYFANHFNARTLHEDEVHVGLSKVFLQYLR